MLSIIIVSYNTRELLRNCLDSLTIYSADAQIIVVDNASSDGSSEMIRQKYPRVRLIELEKNVGFARANNIGFAQATGDFILLLNSDTFLEDDTLMRCVAWMRAHPEIGACSPRLIGFNGVAQPCGHPMPTFWKSIKESFGCLKLPKKPDWLIGAALMIRRRALDPRELLLDPAYFMYWEDTGLSARLLEAGWQLGIFEAGHVRHQGGGSSTTSKGELRPRLHSWFVFGKYHWFAQHRPRWERLGVWLLDLLEVVRKYFRGVVRPGRRYECRQAGLLALGLWHVLSGRTPST